MGSTADSCGSSTPPEDEKQFGVTKPISMAGPGEIDHQRTSDLEKGWIFDFFKFGFCCIDFVALICFFYAWLYLVEAGLYESEEEAAKRLEVLDETNQLGVNPLRRHSRAAPASGDRAFTGESPAGCCNKPRIWQDIWSNKPLQLNHASPEQPSCNGNVLMELLKQVPFFVLSLCP